jgi:folate-binding protein YgfZ
VSNIADISAGRARLRISGADRVAFLHGQCTNDIQRLRPGQSCYAAFLNAKGKMRGDAYIVCLDDAFLLDASAGLRESLETFIITEDVMIEDVSGKWGAWLVIEPQSAFLSFRACEESQFSGPKDTRDSSQARNDIVFAHPLGLGIIGAAPGPVTVRPEELEVLRIEAGIPKWGVDMDENTIPVEAGLENRAISYDKGCYIGQETIARIKTYGHVNRHLVQLILGPQAGTLPTQAGTPVPPKLGRGEKIVAEAKEVGQVTSAACSNRLGKVVALGYVRREFASAGTQLMIGQQPAEVLKIV